jgi:hypothetical protein
MISVIRTFKSNWEINKNWQLLYPFFGIVGSFYMGLKFSPKLLEKPYWLSVLIGLAMGLVFMLFCVVCIKKLENKWLVDARWKLIRIFVIFALTGSSSVYIVRPFINLIGISTENLNPFLYWFLFIITSLIFYQILLVFWAWLLGQFDFFWAFEKKMLYRLGLKYFRK